MLMASERCWRVFVLSVELVVVCCFLLFFGVLGVSVGVEGFVAGVFALFCCFGVDVVCCWCACVCFCGCRCG